MAARVGMPRPVARIYDDNTLLLPDWRGNNRLDSLRNIILDGRVSLMFFVPGCINVVRINGTAVLSIDADLLLSFERDGKTPKTVIEVSVDEVYYQCAKAIMRAKLWAGEGQSDNVPTAGMFISEYTDGIDIQAYDERLCRICQTEDVVSLRPDRRAATAFPNSRPLPRCKRARWHSFAPASRHLWKAPSRLLKWLLARACRGFGGRHHRTVAVFCVIASRSSQMTSAIGDAACAVVPTKRKTRKAEILVIPSA